MKKELLMLVGVLALVMVALPDKALAADSNIACYFNNGTSKTWHWGLTSSNAWYSISGEWKTTAYTAHEKFFSNAASLADICAACENSKKYYKETGEVFAIFAATSGLGKNYPLVLKGVQVSPEY